MDALETREAGEAANFAQAACALRRIFGVLVSDHLSPLADARGYAPPLIIAPPRQGGDNLFQDKRREECGTRERVRNVRFSNLWEKSRLVAATG